MKLYIPFDVHVYDGLKDTDVNFRFTLEEPPYYPSYLCKYHASVYCLDTAPSYCCVCFSGNAVTTVDNYLLCWSYLTGNYNYLSNNCSTNNTTRVVDECSEERRKEAEKDKEGQEEEEPAKEKWKPGKRRGRDGKGGHRGQ